LLFLAWQALLNSLSLSNLTSVLVTGGTGSFGRKFVESILSNAPNLRRLVVFSRDELKQYEMAKLFPQSEYPCIRYFLGDVRDPLRLRRAMMDIDVVIHAAALKHVPAAEYNPFEFVSTNVVGSQNLIEASLDARVKLVIALSTDKAAAPINLYGATKLCADKLFTSANNIRGNRDIRFSVVRYGNVMGSRGSVIPFFLRERESGVLPITHPDMTRFNISLEDGVAMVMWTLGMARGGEIFVPKIPSYRITDLATAVGPNCKQVVVGIRPGEKIHEEMITVSDSLSTVDLGKYYAILPSWAGDNLDRYCQDVGGVPVEAGFSYSSWNNKDFLSIDSLRQMIERLDLAR